MSTRPLNSSSNLVFPDLKAPVTPAAPKPEVATGPKRNTGDLNRAHARLATQAANPELAAAQQLLSAKRHELALKEMAARNEKPKSLWGNITSTVSNLVHSAAKQVSGLQSEVSDLEAKVAHLASQAADAVGHEATSMAASVSSAVSTTATVVKDTAVATGHALSAGVDATAASLKKGKGVVVSLEDGASGAAAQLAKEVINPALDASSLGKANEFKDADGALGSLLTNRLAIGESASIKIEAGATLPTEILGIPNARLDGGGTLEIKRVAKLGANGKPLTEPKDDLGNGPSELKVTLTAEGRAGAFYSAEVGLQAGVTAADQTFGVNASVRAEAEAGLTGKVAFTFAFDPKSAKDMADLTGVIKATAATGAAAAIPGLGPVLGAASAAEHAQDFKAFGRHLESVDGSGGLYAQATASAAADVGMFGATDKSATTGKHEKTYSERNDEETTMDQFVIDLGLLSASAGGQMQIGGKANLRTGEHTIYVDAQGAANASASVLGAGQEGQAAANRRLALTYAKDGSLKSVRIEDTVDKEKFSGLRSTIEDIYGRPLTSGAVAGLSEKDSVKVSYEVKPEVLARLQAKLSGSPGQKAEALGELTKLAVTKDTVKLNVGDVVATSTDALSIGGSMRVSLGAVAGVRAKLTLARSQDKVLD